MASVPLETPTQCLAPMAAANSASKALFSGPVMTTPESITRRAASRSSSRRAPYCSLRSSRGILVWAAVVVLVMSVGSFGEQHRGRGLQDDLEVESEGPVLDVE